MELSILIPALNEEKNIARLILRVREQVSRLVPEHEIIVVDGHSQDHTCELAQRAGAIVVEQDAPGYGGALREGFDLASGNYILTLDADFSHSPDFIATLWAVRERAEVVIASRYVEGGSAEMPFYRRVFSVLLNFFFGRALALPVRDVSSGFRLYNARAVRSLELKSEDFDILEEILIECLARGMTVKEVPFHFVPRGEGRSHVKLLRLGLACCKTFTRMWKLRNSIDSADYDARAFDSLIPLQRYWQRKRHRIITGWAEGYQHCLDVGCGSSCILRDLGGLAIGLDIQHNKLRYARRYGRPLIHASVFALPFVDQSFDCVICSEVIEHIPRDECLFSELARVLKGNGRLILGTPDYGRWQWRLIEWFYARLAPGGYADEHVTHYRRNELIAILRGLRFQLEQTAYVLGSELILAFTKRDQGKEL
ncbi:MAG: glycosyltransferase [Chloroflexi bacterium]|nr:glycosyltransferase [Chloroflexota bacterium]